MLEEEQLVANAKKMGAVLSSMLASMKSKHPSVGDVRSIGLFGAIELVKNRRTKEPMGACAAAHARTIFQPPACMQRRTEAVPRR